MARILYSCVQRKTQRPSITTTVVTVKGISKRLFVVSNLLRSLLILVTLARQADAHPGGHVAHTLGEKELVQLSVHTHIAVHNSRRIRGSGKGKGKWIHIEHIQL